MGREMRSLTVIASLSSHNSEQDRIDEALWEEIKERIGAILAEAKYQDINAMSV